MIKLLTLLMFANICCVGWPVEGIAKGPLEIAKVPLEQKTMSEKFESASRVPNSFEQRIKGILMRSETFDKLKHIYDKINYR